MLTITLLSLVTAAASGLMAWRSIRREHLRADARVASLSAAIDARTGLADFAWGGTSDTHEAMTAFADESLEPAAPRRPLLTVAAGLVVVLTIVVVIAMTGDRYNAPATPAVSAPVESIELLSLRAERDGRTLAVTGIVRSRVEEPLAALVAVVSAVDADGRPLGSSSVLLPTLLPRHESRFVVRLTNVTDAARYRVSFRSAGGVIRHVDRRAETNSRPSRPTSGGPV